MMHRRALLIGLTSLIAAPAVVRAASLMPVRAPKIIEYWPPHHINCRCVISIDDLMRLQWELGRYTIDANGNHIRRRTDVPTP